MSALHHGIMWIRYCLWHCDSVRMKHVGVCVDCTHERWFSCEMALIYHVYALWPCYQLLLISLHFAYTRAPTHIWIFATEPAPASVFQVNAMSTLSIASTLLPRTYPSSPKHVFNYDFLLFGAWIYIVLARTCIHIYAYTYSYISIILFIHSRFSSITD